MRLEGCRHALRQALRATKAVAVLDLLFFVYKGQARIDMKSNVFRFDIWIALVLILPW